MLTIYYQGKTNKEERSIIDSAARFTAKKLFPRFKVSITFIMIKELYETEKIQGDVDYDDDELNPRDFVVRIHKGMQKENLATLIMHELVHVKQYLRKELVFKFDEHSLSYKIYFKGKNITNVKYYDQPHEKEAYRLEEKLYDEYINFINI